LVDRGELRRNDDFEAVADVSLDRTEAEARLVDTEFAGSEVVSKSNLHFVPVKAAEESDSILVTIADAAPEEVLVLKYAGGIDLEDGEIGGTNQERRFEAERGVGRYHIFVSA
jgi:hypothetical protein